MWLRPYKLHYFFPFALGSSIRFCLNSLGWKKFCLILLPKAKWLVLARQMRFCLCIFLCDTTPLHKLFEPHQFDLGPPKKKEIKKNQVNDGLEDVWWAFEIFMMKSDNLKNIKTNIFNNDCTFYNKFNISRQYQLWRTKARRRVFLIYPTHTYKDHFCKLFKLKKLNKSLGSICVIAILYYFK